jgi:hypothetical protein
MDATDFRVSPKTKEVSARRRSCPWALGVSPIASGTASATSHSNSRFWLAPAASADGETHARSRSAARRGCRHRPRWLRTAPHPPPRTSPTTPHPHRHAPRAGVWEVPLPGFETGPGTPRHGATEPDLACQSQRRKQSRTARGRSRTRQTGADWLSTGFQGRGAWARLCLQSAGWNLGRLVVWLRSWRTRPAWRTRFLFHESRRGFGTNADDCVSSL